MQNLMGYRQQAYKKVHVETANPGRVLLQLYDAAIRFVEKAQEQITAGQAGPKGESLRKAHAIIAEFINALDHKMSPELCSNLELIYGFMLEQIAEANVHMNAQALDPVLIHLRSMRETWQIAVNQAQMENAPATGVGGAL
ncbi:MAG: flagellar export chaperone FliS [Deltaproteobacteria bacterium]|nr:flagellar export chaperone FliS [Deltaproteobacteria bacterium]MBN2671688.1 flagellar export chaperone FliS [Deltaproteobacteria bacterium]